MPHAIHQARGSDGQAYEIVERWELIPTGGLEGASSMRGLSGLSVEGRAVNRTGEGQFASLDGSVTYTVE